MVDKEIVAKLCLHCHLSSKSYFSVCCPSSTPCLLGVVAWKCCRLPTVWTQVNREAKKHSLFMVNALRHATLTEISSKSRRRDADRAIQLIKPNTEMSEMYDFEEKRMFE